MQHADVEEMNYLRRESTRKYKQLYYQSQAKKHNVLMITTYSNLLKETQWVASTELSKSLLQDGFQSETSFKLSKDEAKKY